jgi:beta-lactamase class A
MIMIARSALALLVWMAVCPLCLCGENPSLESRLQPLLKAHRGKVGVAVKHLITGEEFEYNADEVMRTASLIKLPVLMEVYQQALEGRVKLDDTVELKESDKVPGSGILTDHFSAGTTISLRTAVRLMIVYSDNTATNLVLDKIGIRSTTARMKSWGFPNTQIHAKVYRGSTTSVDPERTKKFGLGSTTAREMVHILEKLQCGEVATPVARQIMLGHLRKCDDTDKFPRYLPPGTVIAHKTGSLDDTRTDAGIIYLESGPIALCVLTTDNTDKGWRTDNAGNILCAKIAKEVFDYFSAAPVTAADR